MTDNTARLSVPVPSGAEYEDSDSIVRARLLAWIGARLAVCTLVFGGATFLEQLSFASFTGRAFTFIAGFTFVASAAFAWMLRIGRSDALIAQLQLSCDIFLVTALIWLGGGAGSAFSSLYGVVILTAAFLVGPESARATSIASVLIYVVVGTCIANGWVPYPPDQDVARYHLPLRDLSIALLRNVVGLTLLSWLALTLANRVTSARGQLRVAAESVLKLARLNTDIVRAIPAGLLTTDTLGIVRTANPAALAMLNLSLEEIRQKTWSTFFPQAASDDTIAHGDIEATRADGTHFPATFSRTPLGDSAGTLAGQLIVFEDTSELRELRATAERAERLAALGRLAAALAHEIRNPLGSISGSVQLVSEASELSEEDRQLLEVVVREVDRLDDLVTTMLAFGRPRPPEKRHVDVVTVIHEVVNAARLDQAAAKQVTIDIEAPSSVVIRVDQGQIRQVLWNLLKNAIQASKPGARVVVGAEDYGTNERAFFVRDYGDGIAEENLSRLFEFFFTDRPQGSGIGLALVKQIVDAHDGRIEVTTSREAGTTFKAYFPA